MIEQLVRIEPERTARDARLTTILLIGCVSTDERNDLCRVRNISAGGMRIETMAEIDIGQKISVALKNGVTVRSEVVWTRNTEAGLRFEAPVNIEKVLAPALQTKRTGGVQVMRSPRLSAHCPIALRRNGHILPGMMLDLSQGGARLETNGAIDVGDQVVLIIAALGSRRATVRWVRDNDIGLSFADKIGFTDLAQWLAGPDRFSQEPAVSPTRQSS